MSPAASFDGRVVVIDAELRAAALVLASRGATVVVVGADSGAVGELVREVSAAGARTAAFVGDPSVPSDADALAEMLDELY